MQFYVSALCIDLVLAWDVCECMVFYALCTPPPLILQSCKK